MVPGSLSNREFISMILKEKSVCGFYLYPQKYPHISGSGCCLLESVRDISGQAPSLSRGNYPYTGCGEGPGHPGKRPLDLVTGVPVYPAEMSGQIIGNTKSLWVEVSSLYAHPSLVSYSRCSTSRRCISFCAELRNCAISRTLISSPGLAAPRASYIGLSIAFRFCAVPVRRKVRKLRNSAGS